MASLRVDLGARSYPILIGDGVSKEGVAALPRLLKGKKIAVVTNPTVAKLFAAKTLRLLRKAGFKPSVITLPDGEQYKTIKHLARIYDGLIGASFDRADAILALGGGVVGDMAGFAAATYMRGIDFVQFPTTLLSQVDSSVGGKTGIDYPGGKNIVGAFYQPRLVVCDLSALKKLPEREYRCGMAEVIKYGVIRDARFFAWLEDNVKEVAARKTAALETIIRKSCACKAAVVAADEREADVRAILNFGHTFAHGIETALDYKRVKHGEAVAIGMVLAGRLSYSLGLIPQKTAERVKRLIAAYGLPTRLPPYLSANEVIAGMAHDKKIISGAWRLVVYDRIGNAFVKGGLTRAEIAAAMAEDRP